MPAATGPSGWSRCWRPTARLEASADDASLLDALDDRTPADDEELPDTGVGEDLERLLSPPFIVSPSYGTRASTVVRWTSSRVTLRERRFGPDGVVVGERSAEMVPGAGAGAVRIQGD